MVAKAENQRWTYQRIVDELPFESRYELRNYQLIEMASPKPKHQRIQFKLSKKMDSFIEQNQLGEILISPLDVLFDIGDVVQPDIIFVSTNQKNIVEESYIKGIPDLLVEIVSKGSIARDYIEKKNDYERFGVKEYWIIDSMNESIWVYVMNENKKYDLFSNAESGDIAKSKILDGFELKHDLIFEE
jgi:Uma2 family endonuclease